MVRIFSEDEVSCLKKHLIGQSEIIESEEKWVCKSVGYSTELFVWKFPQASSLQVVE